jgi:DNA-binding FadR family transcriptional regulator
MPFRPVSKVPVYVQIAAQLSDAIHAGELKPGEALPPERELAESFGASRASIREALRAMQAQGLLLEREGAPMRAVVAGEASAARRAALVGLLRFDAVELADLVDFRCVIESAALRWAAQAGDHAQLDRARDALAAMEDPAMTLEDFDEADVRFHTALVRASGNEAMHQVMAALREPVGRHMRDALRRRRRPRTILQRLVAEHREILEAVEAGAGDRAAELVVAHIRRFYATTTTRRR